MQVADDTVLVELVSGVPDRQAVLDDLKWSVGRLEFPWLPLYGRIGDLLLSWHFEALTGMSYDESRHSFYTPSPQDLWRFFCFILSAIPFYPQSDTVVLVAWNSLSFVLQIRNHVMISFDPYNERVYLSNPGTPQVHLEVASILGK